MPPEPERLPGERPLPPPGEAGAQRFARELLEILNELRVALPGVQFLFGFMLIAPFSDRFALLTRLEREVFFAGFLAVTVASTLLIAPSVYHRLHWRRDIEDKERMLRTFTALAIGGTAFLAVALTCVVFVLTDYLFGGPLSYAVTVGGGLMFVGFWFALPLARRHGEPRKIPIVPSDD